MSETLSHVLLVIVLLFITLLMLNDVKSNMKEETRAEKISRIQSEIAAAQSELACLMMGDPRVPVIMEPYCPKCFGPCLRRPRHGESNI